MRLTLKREALPLLLLASCWAILAYYWPQLPDPIPTHWGPGGAPDQWMPRVPGALIGPLVATGLYLLMTVIPWIDPRSAHWQSIMRIYPVIKSTLLAFFVLLTHLSLSAALHPGQKISLSSLMVGMGLLFVVLGNYMPTVRSNFFVGVRTPWTLSNDEVWYRTHRLAGRLMVALGLLCFAIILLPPEWQLWVFLAAVLAFTGWSVGYSYWIFRKLVG